MLAPFGPWEEVELAAAVSAAGGLGSVGTAVRSVDELREQWRRPRNNVSCDGRLHVQRFTVDQVEISEFGIPPSPLAAASAGCSSACSTTTTRSHREPGNGMPYINDGFHRVE